MPMEFDVDRVDSKSGSRPPLSKISEYGSKMDKGIFKGDNGFLMIFRALALFVVGASAIAGYLSYSPVPFWDMWTGTLEFFMRAQSGDVGIWWSQHNEHRILLSRIFFWADYAWFGGVSIFLICVNYSLIGATALLFYRLVHKCAGTELTGKEEQVLGLFLVAWIFQWIQFDNMIWGFQSQFIMAQLLPLCGLYWLAKAAQPTPQSSRHFVIGCCFGIASLGTMANGVLALPFMAVYAILARQGIRRIITLVVLAAGGIYLYFHNYHAVGKHGVLMSALKGDPLGFLEYVLFYLGSPFYYIFGKGSAGKLLAAFMALVLIIACLRRLYVAVARPREHTFELAMLLFIAYIGGTAFGTAGGRLFLGTEQALTSRYTTPALMAWAAFIILYYRPLLDGLRGKEKRLLIPLYILSALIVVREMAVFRPDTRMYFERDVSALAMELGIKDTQQIGFVFYNAEQGIQLATQAKAMKLSVFGAEPLLGLREKVGGSMPAIAPLACQGAINIAERLPEDPRYLRIQGWLAGPMVAHEGGALYFLDGDKRVAGAALSGLPGVPLAALGDVPEGVKPVGFKGYVLASQNGQTLSVRNKDAECSLQLQVPPVVFHPQPMRPEPGHATIDSSQVLPGNAWTASDFERTSIPGMVILGSFIRGDVDTGTISLRVKHGDRIFYRSGPTQGAQTLQVLESKLPVVMLPVAHEWSLIDLSDDFFPQGEFVITLSDKGSNWGEWSAIAINAPASQLELTTMEPSLAKTSIRAQDVLSDNAWTGSDFEKTTLSGMQIFGSVIHGDADIGSISLRVKRGDTLFYRSGPTGGHQVVEIAGVVPVQQVLPVSLQWSRLRFSGEHIPEDGVMVKFSDQGSAWGEWSAIALRK